MSSVTRFPPAPGPQCRAPVPAQLNLGQWCTGALRANSTRTSELGGVYCIKKWGIQIGASGGL